MKKISSLLLAVVLIFTLVALTACGAKEPSGTYTGYLAEMPDFPVFELTFEDGKVMSVFLMTGESSVGTYTITDNEVYCEYDKGTHDTLTYDPETDTLSIAGGVIIYEKEK